ncbi:MAG: aldose 1-epimerase family protein [Solirubrobacterales bacterium]|nr:aldose 1-epimerase family protein [Solirubrobacterales bacterium]
MAAAHQPLPPSGEQIELVAAEHRAVVVEVGGALRELQLGGRALLDGYSEREMCTGARGQPLLPWPNRLRDGSYRFGGEPHRLALSEPERGNAIHGLVRWVNWTVAERTPERVVMSHRLHPQPGYPFALALRIEYQLAASGLTVTTTATNVGQQRCPYGAGAHPYLTAGAETIDDCTLTVPAASRLETDERGIPTATAPVSGTAYDFRRPRRVGSERLDTCYCELLRDDDARARVILQAPGGRVVTLWADQSYPYLMVFTGDTLPATQRRRGLAVEPMTCPPNAFASGDGVRVLEPGESLAGSWGIGGE